MPKSFGARTQPCFIQLLMGKGDEDEPRKKCTVPFMSEKRRSCSSISVGTLILSRSLNRPFLLTRSNALVRSRKARYRGLFS